MSRLPATDRAHRLGTLLINTGGPGASGLSDVLPVREWLRDVGSRYDLIGMDPRFVGRSTPLDCGWPVGTWLRAGGPDRASFEQTAAFEAALARRCVQRHSDVLPYVTTRNTARDMDRIRTALGEPTLSYVGYSYGTYLGAVYAQMFPARAGHMVLDGAVDPVGYGPRLLRGAGRANEAAMQDWARWTAGHHAEYALGSTRAAVVATVDRILAVAGRRSLRGATSGSMRQPCGSCCWTATTTTGTRRTPTSPRPSGYSTGRSGQGMPSRRHLWRRHCRSS